MSSDLLVGIDVGSTLCKAALVTLAGEEVAHGSCPTPWEAVPTGAEVDPTRLFGAVVEAVHAALRPHPDARVVAVGVTSMAETGILLDARGAPVAPAIAWHDRRGEEEARRLADELGPDRFTAATGLPPTRLPSMVKYRWLRDHEPRAAEGARWLTVAEWIVRELGGEPPAELSLASRTGFLDVARGRWWDEALDWAGAPAGLLAEPAVAGAPAGRSRGIRPLEGAILTVAGHDHLCAAVGAGATRPGDLFDSCGTAEALVRALRPPVPEADVNRAVAGGVALGWHVIEGRRVLLGGFLCGLVLQRCLDELGVDENGLGALGRAALEAPAAAEAIVLDVGLDAETLGSIASDAPPPLVWRAALEATAAAAAAIKATTESVAGATERLVVSGGWARDPAVLAVKRERLGDFERPNVAEAGARGAALLGGLAAGLYGSVDDMPPPPASKTRT